MTLRKAFCKVSAATKIRVEKLYFLVRQALDNDDDEQGEVIASSSVSGLSDALSQKICKLFPGFLVAYHPTKMLLYF